MKRIRSCRGETNNQKMKPLIEINQNDFDPDDVFEEIPINENSEDES